MLKSELQSREGYEYVNVLLQDKQQELRDLEVKYERTLIGTEDYLTCRRSLLQAVAQLEELILK